MSTQNEKSDIPNGFPEDIFQAGGEKGQPEDSTISQEHHHQGNPFENWDQPLLTFSSRSSSSSSSSDSDSSVDPFQVNHTEDHHQPMPPLSVTQEEQKDDDKDHNGASSHNSTTPKTNEPDSTRATGVTFFNPRHTPPIQVMDRSENYDPGRIPASVFTPKSSSPMDWSVASNESLFSIQVGNNSFNRDHFLLMGVDLRRSGELLKSGELQKSGELYKSGELFSITPMTPVTSTTPFTIAETRESVDRDTTDLGTPKSPNSSAKAIMDDKSESPPHKEDQTRSQPVSTNLSTISSHSDGSGVSGASIGSFAFPILTEGKRDSTEKEEPVADNLPHKQASKTSMRQSISQQLSARMPSCNLCCCYCSCSCFSWRPRCWGCCR